LRTRLSRSKRTGIRSRLCPVGDRLPAAALDLVEAYLTEFDPGRFRAVSSAEDGARAFCAQFDSPAGWTAAPLAAQVDADERAYPSLVLSEGSKYAGLGYSVVKDLFRLGRREALRVHLEADGFGSTVHLRLTARTGLGAGKVTVKRCFAIRWVPYSGCIEGDERNFSEVRFRPVGQAITTLEGLATAEWRATLNRDRVLHLETAAQRQHDIEVFGQPETPSKAEGSLDAHQMKIAAVVVTGTGKPVRSNEVFIPPMAPFKERLAEWWAARSEAKRRDEH